MARTTFLLLFLISFINIHQNYCLAQNVKIEITSLEVINNKLLITYDFIGGNKSNSYDVWVEITTSSGQRIAAKTISGDKGDNIGGGQGKQIIWDYIADEIVLDAKINVEVKALISKPEIVESTEISTGKAVLLSAVFPGWGLSKLDQGKPYWILGASSYALLAGSVFLNNQAYNEYMSYSNDLDRQSSDKRFDKSKSLDKQSKIAAYSAIGIWAVNLIWTIAKGSKAETNSFGSLNHQKFFIFSSVDKRLGTTSITFRYKF